MNPHLARLHAYPFERLARLKSEVRPPAHLPHVAMSIGEPQHAPPRVVLEALERNHHCLGSYPAIAGTPELRAAAAHQHRPRQVGLERRRHRDRPRPRAAAAVGLREGFAEPYFLDVTAATRYAPDLTAVPQSVWQRCQVLFLCNPGNPTGAVLTPGYLEQALALADRYGFVIAADECYAEIYTEETEAPPSLLQSCLATGRKSFERCIVFHSLSKRSSVPGLRSGFVAGDPQIIASFLLYRTYHGNAMALPTQAASVAAWNDDAHVAANRRLYQQKFARVVPILSSVMDIARPAGAFYLWPDIGGDDEAFAQQLYAAQNVTVLPGSYLGRPSSGGNPGSGRVRISLVPDVDSCVAAAERIREFVNSHA